jgi:aspartyl-tRNA(Asn)/glutamyl-tRNA(Gln) amidotransferase subunit C
MANQLTDQDVLKLAKLSRLIIKSEELEMFKKDINEVLDFVSMLDEVEVEEVKPTNQVTGLQNVTRADETIDYHYSVDLFLNASKFDNGYLVVPKIIDEN